MIAFGLSFIAWALLHSLTAARSGKAFFRRQMGERTYEERRLVAYFGEAYRRYQEGVPRLFPRFWRGGDKRIMLSILVPKRPVWRKGKP